MCGIAGYRGISSGRYLDKMLETIEHRGPDDSGAHTGRGLAFGMRRLSIIDLEKGQQPLTNEDGSVHLVFNGEIYNYRQLRDELVRRGHHFASHSDTEVIVHLYEEVGMECLQSLRGMFAFALFDARRDALYIARDRLGIKPIYYWQDNSRLVFGSEIKSILSCPDVSRTARRSSIDAYMSLRYVPGPATLFEGIYKLPAGHFLTHQAGQTTLSQYWKPDLAPGSSSPEEYQDAFNDLFEDAVRSHMESDVPVGAFLSGGVDSSALVAAASKVTPNALKTFSVGFNWSKDETGHARYVADRYGTDHHEVECRGDDFGLLPKIVWHLDEPIGDAIVLPMYLVSRLASEHVKVVLSGEGADEILAGYPFHKVLLNARRLSRRLPAGVLRKLLPTLLEATPVSAIRPFFPHPGRFGQRSRTKLADFLRLLAEDDVAGQYRHLISLFDQRDKPALYTAQFADTLEPDIHAKTRGTPDSELNHILSLQYADWLPDDILTKVDKTSMASSLEARVPFMDHRLVEFVNRVPESCKLNGSKDKVLLRDYLESQGLGRIASRPKTPFYIPVEEFSRSKAFTQLVDECLSPESVRSRGYFDPQAVKNMRERLDQGDFLYGKQVLSLVILELWHRMFIDGERGWA